MGEGSDRRCNASTAVYLMTTGALRHSAAFPIEQLVRMPERDGYGPVEYRFSASAEYRDTSIELTAPHVVLASGSVPRRSLRSRVTAGAPTLSSRCLAGALRPLSTGAAAISASSQTAWQASSTGS